MYLVDVGAHEVPGMPAIRKADMPIPEILQLLAFNVDRARLSVGLTETRLFGRTNFNACQGAPCQGYCKPCAQ